MECSNVFVFAATSVNTNVPIPPPCPPPAVYVKSTQDLETDRRRLQETLRREVEARKRVDRMLRGYKDEVSTLRQQKAGTSHQNHAPMKAPNATTRNVQVNATSTARSSVGVCRTHVWHGRAATSRYCVSNLPILISRVSVCLSHSFPLDTNHTPACRRQAPHLISSFSPTTTASLRMFYLLVCALITCLERRWKP